MVNHIVFSGSTFLIIGILIYFKQPGDMLIMNKPPVIILSNKNNRDVFQATLQEVDVFEREDIPIKVTVVKKLANDSYKIKVEVEK